MSCSYRRALQIPRMTECSLPDLGLKKRRKSLLRPQRVASLTRRLTRTLTGMTLMILRKLQTVQLQNRGKNQPTPHLTLLISHSPRTMFNPSTRHLIKLSCRSPQSRRQWISSALIRSFSLWICQFRKALSINLKDLWSQILSSKRPSTSRCLLHRRLRPKRILLLSPLSLRRVKHYSRSVF